VRCKREQIPWEASFIIWICFYLNLFQPSEEFEAVAETLLLDKDKDCSQFSQ